MRPKSRVQQRNQKREDGMSLRTLYAVMPALMLCSCGEDPSAAKTISQPELGPFSAWLDPVNLGPIVNTASNESGPSISGDGLSLYFQSNRPGGLGRTDMYVTRRATVND